MDAVGFSGQVEEEGSALGVGSVASIAPSRRRAAGRTACAGRRIVSDLGPHLPVNDDEIRLVLGLLGDTIQAVLDPGHDPCPSSDSAGA